MKYHTNAPAFIGNKGKKRRVWSQQIAVMATTATVELACGRGRTEIGVWWIEPLLRMLLSFSLQLAEVQHGALAPSRCMGWIKQDLQPKLFLYNKHLPKWIL